MEFTNSEYTNRFIVYFMVVTFSTALYAAIGAAVDNQTDSQQFLYPLLCL
jgi:ABC-type Na+ efflux pump permease subunit